MEDINMSIRTRRRKAEKNRKEKEKKGKGKNKITKDVNIEMSKEKSELFEVIEDVDDPDIFILKKMEPLFKKNLILHFLHITMLRM